MPRTREERRPEAERLGAELRRLREAAGLSQAALGERLGVGQVAVAKWESGDRSPPLWLLGALAAALAGAFKPRSPRAAAAALAAATEPGREKISLPA